MTENNNECKAQFFANYLNAPLYGKGKDPYITLDGVIGKKIYYRYGFEPDRQSWSFIDKESLFLRSLQDISDEEAIEVAKIFGLKDEPFFDGSNSDGIYIKERRKFTYTCDIFFNGNIYSNVGTSQSILAAYDYLRSRGFALPYKDLSVEKMVSWGWLKIRKV